MESKEKNNTHFGHRERLRNLVFKTRLSGSSEYQVLEYLLSFVIARKDTNPIAHDLIDKFGNLKNIFNASEKDLIKIDGVGKHTASFLRSLPIVFEYYNNKFELPTHENLNTPLKIAKYATPYFKKVNAEQLMVIVTDAKGNTITHSILSLNDRESINIKGTKIFSMLDLHNSKHFIIVHNHIGISCQPSIKDNSATRKLVFSSIANDIKMFDHVIIGSDGFYSYRACGALDIFEKESLKVFP